MRLDKDKLAALQAVVGAGSLDGAAEDLGVTPSAISQRTKALEADVGQVVVTTGKPCVATAVGEVLVRHARQLSMLTAETRKALAGPDSGWTDVPIVVNADSLATWFRPGCEIHPLGTMRYLAVARRELAERFTEEARLDLGAMPMVQFNQVDGLQRAVLAAAGGEHRGKTHYVPSCADFRYAVEIGLGWGVLPLAHAENGLSSGS